MIVKQTAASFVVTNDDGILSPLLHFFLRELASRPWCRELRPVVPKEEQSWVAQSVTRFRHLTVEKKVLFDNLSAHIVDGSPADCASLGIAELYADRPDFLLSGINLGTNESLAFYLNSGTVGGARQGIVFGCRGIAISLKLPQALFALWRALDIEALAACSADWERVAKVTCSILEKLLSAELWRGVDLYTINLPWEVTESSAVKICALQRVTYPSIFHPFADGVFRHRLEALHDGERAIMPEGIMGDREALAAGAVALTPIYYDLLPRDEKLLTELRRTFAN